MAEAGDSIVTPSLKDFKLQEILSNNAVSKKIVLLGEFPESDDPEQRMIVIVEKVEFAEDNFKANSFEDDFLKHVLMNEDDLTVPTMANDIYADFTATIDPRLNSKLPFFLLRFILQLLSFLELKVSTIYPATNAHVKKYSQQEFFTFNETPDMYKKITLPHLSAQKFTLDWVYNILEGKKEADRVDYKDEDPKNGFVLVKDMKWTGQVESLHMTSIVLDREIKSLRDLNASHLPMLENIQTNCFATIKAKYGLDETKVRAFFHYHPSYYHLHVHFTNLSFDASGINCDRGHLLSTVICNIQLMSDYYQKATIPFVTGKDFGLYKAIVESQLDKGSSDKQEVEPMQA